MKMNCFYVFLVLLSVLVFVTPVRGQAVEELELNVSRDFGSSDGMGNIQGTFSSPNLLVGKLVRCPNCGKWSLEGGLQ